jgi:hypothetical protein
MKKFRKWICKHFGHRFNPVLLLMFEIEHKSENREIFRNETIECERCGAEFRHKF